MKYPDGFFFVGGNTGPNVALIVAIVVHKFSE